MSLCISSCRYFENTFENTQWRKVQQMQPVWLCILLSKRFEDTFENAQRRKDKQMHPMWFYMFWSKFFEETCKKTHWAKVKQMQPVWLCILSGRQIENTFEKTQWRKIDQADAFQRIYNILLSISIYFSCLLWLTDHTTISFIHSLNVDLFLTIVDDRYVYDWWIIAWC